MAMQDELKAELQAAADRLWRPHVKVRAIEHTRLRVDSDDGPRWALDAAAGFAAIPDWQVREVHSESGQQFTLLLTVERSSSPAG
ncbi:hypothetical protein [Kitasatospora azatica]|uniref:hypothetical protein n=1 Tax=Kitasatospora azatica TaxID=58347 RepID=UPI00056C25A4|nr:hypothetical protein [Kitasatospora azatica]